MPHAWRPSRPSPRCWTGLLARLQLSLPRPAFGWGASCTPRPSCRPPDNTSLRYARTTKPLSPLSLSLVCVTCAFHSLFLPLPLSHLNNKRTDRPRSGPWRNWSSSSTSAKARARATTRAGRLKGWCSRARSGRAGAAMSCLATSCDAPSPPRASDGASAQTQLPRAACACPCTSTRRARSSWPRSSCRRPTQTQCPSTCGPSEAFVSFYAARRCRQNKNVALGRPEVGKRMTKPCRPVL